MLAGWVGPIVCRASCICSLGGLGRCGAQKSSNGHGHMTNMEELPALDVIQTAFSLHFFCCMRIGYGLLLAIKGRCFCCVSTLLLVIVVYINTLIHHYVNSLDVMNINNLYVENFFFRCTVPAIFELLLI